MMPVTKLLIATHNPGKFSEIKEVLGELPIILLSLDDAGIPDEVKEIGATHEENALLKASYFYGLSKLPTLAEDSGIYADAFPGELGVMTRRFRELHEASDKEWIEYFLREMADIPDGKRDAKFVCCAVFILDGEPYYFHGETHGVITKALEAPLRKGIPLSSCFRPEGFEKVYAALSIQEKNQVSHRGQAMRKVRDFLRPYVGQNSS